MLLHHLTVFRVFLDRNPRFTTLHYIPNAYSGGAVVMATGKSSKLYMQNLAASECTTTPKTVYDKRDEESYLVQRLADGNCWLLDNLRLDLTKVTLANLRGNTNATNTILGYLKNGGGTSPYASKGVSATWPTTDSYNLPFINVNYKNTVASVTHGSASGKIGVFYNYCAASAGSYCYTKENNNGDATYDICPSGWRMPTGVINNRDGDFYNLYEAYSSSITKMANALSMPYSGVFSRVDGGLANQGSVGYAWTRTYANSESMQHLRISSDAYISSSANMVGLSVRCILSS